MNAGCLPVFTILLKVLYVHVVYSYQICSYELYFYADLSCNVCAVWDLCLMLFVLIIALKMSMK